MSIQKSFTFYTGTQSEVDWGPITDGNGNQVNTAALTLTIYWGRDKVRPDLVPGTPVQNANSVTMTFASSTNTWAGLFTILSANAPSGGDYTLVIDATLQGAPFDHWERPTVILNTGL